MPIVLELACALGVSSEFPNSHQLFQRWTDLDLTEKTLANQVEKTLKKHYIFFTRNILPQVAAHLIHDVSSANAAANLDYAAVLVYIQKRAKSLNFLDALVPFKPKNPSDELIRFYNLQDKLKVIPLPMMPFPFDCIKGKWTNPSTLVCKYYFPFHIFKHTKILHTLDWNLVKTAIKFGIPVIYEREHYSDHKYDKNIVDNPLFKVAVTVADNVREDMIKKGMNPEKIIKLHSGFNQCFLVRQPENASVWKKKLLVDGHQYLVVYAGGLYAFKGVDLLIEVAKKLPQVKFALAGGDKLQVEYYQQVAREKQAKNVTFLGYIQHEQLPSLLQAADVLAHPHCSGEAATFTSPLKFFEYLASGTPIVATEIPPLREFKAKNVVAAWCKPDNPEQFALCLQYVLETYPKKDNGNLDTIDFARQFSWESRIAKIMRFVSSRR